METGVTQAGRGNRSVSLGSHIQLSTVSRARLTESQLDTLAAALVIVLTEATGEYYYDEVTVKRWILGPGGASGNCELCNDNADAGWIDMDDIFEGVEEDIDEPPAHPNCECEVEYKEKRVRVYV